MGDETVSIPTALAARLRTAESLRVELDAVTRERNELRHQLDETAWERDAAQHESAFMREELLQLDPSWREGNPRVSLVLLSCDSWTDIPDAGSSYDEIALVSLSGGQVYIRQHANTWARYGQDTLLSDYANLADKGPWVTVGTWHLRDHKALADAKRAFYTARHNAMPYSSLPHPERSNDVRGQLARDTSSPDNPARLIERLGSLAKVLRTEWQKERDRADALQERLPEEDP